jgi:hypothetical protein
MPLSDLVEAELSEPVDPRVTELASAIAAQYGSAARAVLFYGSCLREENFEDLMLDFYLIVSAYEAAWPGSWLATANRLIPPNVFPFTQGGLASKYAVLSEADFRSLNGPEASTVSVWARFSQPTRLVWVSDQKARAAVFSAVARAAPTLFRFAQPLARGKDALAIWEAGFAETYKAELRAERAGRSGSIVASSPERYQRFAEAMEPPPMLSEAAAKARWRQLQRRGKWTSIARLAKASFTFSGGIDYLAWKINRHAGTRIEVMPWQRKWPLLAALFLLPKLIARGAVR